ncbi:MAG: hypothetical protein AAF743_00240 [Planctomycetota bacterium]
MCRSQDDHLAEHIKVRVCGHGTIHATIGPTTLHLLPEEAALLFCGIAEVARRWPPMRSAIEKTTEQYVDAKSPSESIAE